MPQYTEKDLAVCHRQNAKGAWKCELWTKRDFGPRELCFAPLASQIKETHLTLSANCQVGVPVKREHRAKPAQEQLCGVEGVVWRQNRSVRGGVIDSLAEQ